MDDDLTYDIEMRYKSDDWTPLSHGVCCEKCAVAEMEGAAKRLPGRHFRIVERRVTRIVKEI